MKPELRPITKLTVASTTALFLLATPLAVDWRTLDIDSAYAEAKGDNDGKRGSGGGGGGGLGGAVGDAADNAAEAVGDAADGVAGAVGDAADGAAGAVGDAADGAAGAVGDAADAVGDAADAVADGATDSVDVGDSSGSGDVIDGSAPADDAASDETVAESDAAPDTIDTAEDAVETASEVVDETADAVSETVPEASTDDATSVSTGATGRVALSSPRVTVSITTIRRKPAHGDGGDKHRLAGARSVTSTVMVDLPPDDATAGGLAAIEPSAGPAVPPAPQPEASASANCAADDGHQQGTEISCLVAGSEDVRTRQVAYAPSGATGDGQTPDVTTNRQIAPPIEKRPDGPSFYDELYGLQQVEARRYVDGDVPVLIVQGIVSNMSNGQRSVPPLLAIVQNDQGKELMRWTFRAEAEALGPGGSTGFRSEMFDPQSESAKVTIVFAAEQQTMQ